MTSMQNVACTASLGFITPTGTRTIVFVLIAHARSTEQSAVGSTNARRVSSAIRYSSMSPLA